MVWNRTLTPLPGIVGTSRITNLPSSLSDVSASLSSSLDMGIMSSPAKSPFLSVMALVHWLSDGATECSLCASLLALLDILVCFLVVWQGSSWAFHFHFRVLDLILFWVGMDSCSRIKSVVFVLVEVKRDESGIGCWGSTWGHIGEDWNTL